MSESGSIREWFKPSLSTPIDGPTTTTKALLVVVTAPRKISAKKDSFSSDDETTDGQNEQEAKSSAGEEEQGGNDKVSQNATSGEEGAIIASTKTGEKNPVSEEIASKTAKEETSPPPLPETAIATGDKEEDKEEKKSEEEEEENQEEPTPEQAAAVRILSHDPNQSEVNVEELIRLTFQSLLEEYHFLTIPTYNLVGKAQKDISMASNLDEKLNRIQIEEDTQNWIHVEVMARPASLGIILDRLDHIGVGSQVGTVAVFQSELCRTASPYLFMPEKEEKTEDTESLSNEHSPEKPDSDKAYDEESKRQESERAIADKTIEEARKEWKNAATRLRIEQVREQIYEQASLSFDFMALLSVASILAGIGLITNNTVVIVASMLVSPIMGPVMGCCFGSRVAG